nr:MAG TPA: hypothetical protein [Caudoviricetes sp.]
MAITAKAVVSVENGCGVIMPTSNLTIADGILCIGMSKDHLEPIGRIRKWLEIAGNRIVVGIENSDNCWHLVGVSLCDFSELYFSSFEKANKEEDDTTDPDEDQWF